MTDDGQRKLSPEAVEQLKLALIAAEAGLLTDVIVLTVTKDDTVTGYCDASMAAIACLRANFAGWVADSQLARRALS